MLWPQLIVWRKHRICVVIPAYDEERLIAQTVASVPDFIDRVVVVDDGSRDATWQELSRLGSPRTSRLRHLENRGVGGSIVSGYQCGLRLDADVLVVMAGDNQMAPADLPALLDAVVVAGADYAKGNRLLHPAKARMPRLRRWGSSFLSWLTRRTTGLSVDDCQCGYTALRASVARELLLDELWPRYGYPNDLLALLAAAGARVVDVPVTPVYAGEASGLHAGHMVSISLRILRRASHSSRLSRRHRPLEVSSSSGTSKLAS